MRTGPAAAASAPVRLRCESSGRNTSRAPACTGGCSAIGVEKNGAVSHPRSMRSGMSLAGWGPAMQSWSYSSAAAMNMGSMPGPSREQQAEVKAMGSRKRPLRQPQNRWLAATMKGFRRPPAAGYGPVGQVGDGQKDGESPRAERDE